MLIQNAVMVDGQIYISRHRHDFVQFEIDGIKHFIDGGLDYIRTDCFDSPRVTFLSLDDHSPIEEKVSKLLWGKSENGKTKWILLKDCSTDHLQNILDKCPISNMYREVIEFILKDRNHDQSKD